MRLYLYETHRTTRMDLFAGADFAAQDYDRCGWDGEERVGCRGDDIVLGRAVGPGIAFFAMNDRFVHALRVRHGKHRGWMPLVLLLAEDNGFNRPLKAEMSGLIGNPS